MGRNWPPNSFSEWMVGQNFRSQRPQTTTTSSNSVQSPVLRVEISEDEASGDETVAITYPRRRHRRVASQQAAAAVEPTASESVPATNAAARKVRFDGEKPLKSALKKTTAASASSSDDTLVDTSETSEDTTTTDDGSSDVDESDTSGDDVPVRRRRSKPKKLGPALCQKDTDSEDSSAAKDALPHETCGCKDCKKGRKILKAVMRLNAKKEAAEKGVEAKANDGGAKKENKAKAKEKQGKGKKNDEETTTDATDTSQAETTEANTTEDEKKQQKGKSKKEDKKEKETVSPKENEAVAEKILKAVNKAAFKMPKYPKEMEPNLIMPIRSKVMQVEHALEGPDDPQPNAFFDAAKGIARVYHGPQYGNHMAELYGKSNSARLPPGPGTPNHRGFPAGWAGHPAYAPWLFPGPPPRFPGPVGPPGTPYGQNIPVMNVQPPRNEAEMKAAAAKGFGLSGQPAPQTPAAIREFRREEQQKAASENASKKNERNWNSGGGGGNDWGGDNNANTASWGKPPSPPPPAAANPDPPADASQGHGWSGNGAAAWDSGGPKRDGVASPANFASWDNGNGNRFERQSNKGGSQKDGSQRNWATGKPDSQPAGSIHNQSAKDSPNKPADWSQGGGGDQWDQNGNQNSGWSNNNQQNGNNWGAGSQNNGDWGQGNNNNGNGWGAPGATGEQGQPSHAPYHASSSPPKPPADAGNGSQANTGVDVGGGGWGQTNNNNNNNNNNGWGAPPPGSARGGGSKNNSPPNQQQQGWGDAGNQQQNPWDNNPGTQQQQQPWGGPPGSKPASQRHSSPRNHNNNTSGGNGWQSGGNWGDNNNGKQTSPPQMPGGWSNRGSRHFIPNENGNGQVGAFPWPQGQGPPSNDPWKAHPVSPAGGGGGGGGGVPPQGGGGGGGWNTCGGAPGWSGAAAAPQKDTSSWGKPDYIPWSNQATGASYTNNNNTNSSWQNAEIAQHTRGAADNW